jgi:hypothetical protein
MQTWKLGLSAVALVGALASCGGGSAVRPARSASSAYPIKSGEVWVVAFQLEKPVTFGFGLSSAPEYDNDSDAYAEFKTSENAEGGYGWLYGKTGNFDIVMVIDDSDDLEIRCKVPGNANFANAIRGVGKITKGKQETDGIPCAVQRTK